MLEINTRAKLNVKQTKTDQSDWWIPIAVHLHQRGINLPDAINIAKRCVHIKGTALVINKESPSAIVMSGFLWGNQPEGTAFWQQIFYQLAKGNMKIDLGPMV